MPLQIDDQSEEPDEFEVLQRVIDERLIEMNICCPGFIESYDPATVTASVVAVFKAVYEDDDGAEVAEDMPVIQDVPVQFPCGGGFALTFPLAKGDPVLLVFSQRSLDAWAASDGKTTLHPEDHRRHHLSDAVALAGLSPAAAPIATAHAANVVLAKADDSVHLSITPAGEIQMKATAVRLGADGANKALALATETKARLDQIQGAFDIHMHPTAAVGPPSPPVTPIGGLAGIASTKVFTDA